MRQWRDEERERESDINGQKDSDVGEGKWAIQVDLRRNNSCDQKERQF